MEAYRVRKPNRSGGPVRVTQRGTATAYPQPHWKKLSKKRDRYAGTAVRHRSGGAP